MSLNTDRRGRCLFAVTEQPVTADRSALLFKAHGVMTSDAFADFLDSLRRAGQLQRHALMILDSRNVVDRHTDAHAMYRQAEVLLRAGVRSLHACDLSDGEATRAYAVMLTDIYRQAGIRAEVRVCPSLDDAVAWLREHA
ncbi:hypothetical protein [uncultured Rhodospira sp.]|uniref:hypothetical protein n=1 Tax=uncultured Rhodospira sp. TaxID=1936189 RepID=UPI00260C0D2D|nr:hypothetical protein [uncultured Rhodospira sp.]